jgi:hypothetical protein
MIFEHITKFTTDCKNVKINPKLLTENYPDYFLIIEFKQNFVSIPTTEGKEGVILHYLNELDDCLHALIDYFPNNEIDDEIILEPNSENIVGVFNKFYELIQQYCMFYNLDFYKLCKQIGFDLSVISLDYFEIETNTDNAIEIELQQDNEKIYLLYKMGVVDDLRKKHKGLSNLKIGEILFPVTGIRANTTAQFLGRFDMGIINPKVISKIESIINRLKLN